MTKLWVDDWNVSKWLVIVGFIKKKPMVIHWDDFLSAFKNTSSDVLVARQHHRTNISGFFWFFFFVGSRDKLAWCVNHRVLCCRSALMPTPGERSSDVLSASGEHFTAPRLRHADVSPLDETQQPSARTSSANLSPSKIQPSFRVLEEHLTALWRNSALHQPTFQNTV